MKHPNCYAYCLTGLLLIGVLGCGESGPEIVPVSGKLMLRGKPLPKAMVIFIPTMDLDAKYMAVGETDDQGQFELWSGDEQGACVCEHKVTVREGGYPPELLSETKQAELNAYIRSLKNRPIPKVYESPVSTPLKITVTADQAVYDLELR